MAKTIKEMAHDHIVAYMHNDEYEEMQDTYIAGANYVLEEIEKLVKFNRWAAQDLYELIEQLKK